jgi:hypothetical protein
MLNPNLQTKRFRFWIFYYGNKNPSLNSTNPEYFFELQNYKATYKICFVGFLKDTKVIFFKIWWNNLVNFTI